MNSLKILTQIKGIIEKNLKIAVNCFYSSNQTSIPITETTILTEIHSATNQKIIVLLKTIVPQKHGADFCRNVTQNAVDLLQKANLDGFQEVVQFGIDFENSKDAYVQKFKICFELKQFEETSKILVFGSEKINVLGNTEIKLTRDYTTFYSPIAGFNVTDLGYALKQITGTAAINSEQFNKLSSFIEKGSVQETTIENLTFPSSLITLSRNLEGISHFTFIEAKK